jgi:hypothetical protein
MQENIVYHYCGVNTFLDIIRNHTLRLSDLCNSTDNLEMKSLLETIKESVKNIYKNDSSIADSVIYGMTQDEAFYFLLDAVIEKMKKDSNSLLYGVCFSEEGDLLGQWREYANKGKGLSIGFDVGWFQKLCLEHELFKFCKVSYSLDKDMSSTIDDRAAMIYGGITDALVSSNTRGLFEDINGGSYSIHFAKELIFQDSLFIKHEEYKEEKEWRLIIDDEEAQKSYDDWITYYNWKGEEKYKQRSIEKLIPNALEFMVKNDKIISYMDLKYDYSGELPIKQIYIGPNCKVMEDDIFHLLEFYGFDANHIRIGKSKSSYCL